MKDLVRMLGYTIASVAVILILIQTVTSGGFSGGAGVMVAILLVVVLPVVLGIVIANRKKRQELER